MVSQTPHKPTKRKPHQDARVDAPTTPTKRSIRSTQAVRGKHARIDASTTKTSSRQASQTSDSRFTGSDKQKQTKEQKQTKKQHRKKGFTRGKKIGILVGLAVCALAVVIALLILNAQADERDIQGEWQIQGTQATISITDTKIILTSEVSYDYTIDPWSHSINLGFFGATGNARYMFDADRNALIITESNVDDEGETVENMLTLVRPGVILESSGGEEGNEVGGDEQSG